MGTNYHVAKVMGKFVRVKGVFSAQASPGASVEALMECTRRFPFDTVLMGVNAADEYYYSFEKDLMLMR